MRLNELQVRQNVVRRFRKQLLGEARRGRHNVRIVGDRGGYALAVERGSSLFVCSPTFEYKGEAELWNARKTGRKLPTRGVKAGLRRAA